MVGFPVEFTLPSGFNRGSKPNDTPYSGNVNAELFGDAAHAQRARKIIGKLKHAPPNSLKIKI
jgi:hypothetical protein